MDSPLTSTTFSRKTLHLLCLEDGHFGLIDTDFAGVCVCVRAFFLLLLVLPYFSSFLFFFIFFLLFFRGFMDM